MSKLNCKTKYCLDSVNNLFAIIPQLRDITLQTEMQIHVGIYFNTFQMSVLIYYIEKSLKLLFYSQVFLKKTFT